LNQVESFDDSHAVTLMGAGPGAESRALTPGEIIGGSYRLKSLLGRGGMGYVFCAEHTMIKHDYALKMLAAEQLNDVSRRRFEAEGRVIATFNHPNIVKVYNMGIDKGNSPFYVMDLLDGVPLSDCIDKAKGMELADCLDIFGQIAAGLGYAHSKGVIHRDIKPSNVVLLSQNDGQVQVKIVDFGIAKVLNASDLESQSRTAPGEVFGSPYYMSPEQCLGDVIDARSDIYSLGCSLFEALTGNPPFRGGNALETVMMHQSAPVPSVSALQPGKTIPASVDVLLARMMAKKPEDRYQSMEQLGHDLTRIKEGRPIGKSAVIGGTESDGDSNSAEGSTGAASIVKSAVAMGLVVVCCVAGGLGLLFYRQSAAKQIANPAVVATSNNVATSGDAIRSAASKNAASKDSAGGPAISTTGGPTESIEAEDEKFGLVQSIQKTTAEQWEFPPARVAAATKEFSNCRTIVSRLVTTAEGQQRKINFPKVAVGLVSTHRGDEQEAIGDVYVRDHSVGLAVKADQYVSIQVPIVFSRFAPDVIGSLRLTGKKMGVFERPKALTQAETEHLNQILEYASRWSDLHFLSLNSFTLNDNTMTMLDAIPHLEHLELHNIDWQVYTKKPPPAFSRLEELQILHMADAGVFCKYVKGSAVLRKVKFDFCPVRGEDLLLLRRCPNFKAVEIGNTKIDDSLVDVLVSLPNLQFINFSSVYLTRDQLTKLGACARLTNVRLDSNNFEPDVRQEFAGRYHNLKFVQSKSKE